GGVPPGASAPRAHPSGDRTQILVPVGACRRDRGLGGARGPHVSSRSDGTCDTARVCLLARLAAGRPRDVGQPPGHAPRAPLRRPQRNPRHAPHDPGRRRAFDLLDRARIDEGFARTGHTIVPLVWELARVVGEPHGGWVHWGATTQNITQTGDLLVLRQAHGIFLKLIGDALLAAADL